MFIIKFAFYFTFSFLILSFPIGSRPIFWHLSKVSAPLTKDLFGKINQSAKKSIDSGLKWSKKLFSNSDPQTDKVSTKFSSTKKKKTSKKIKRSEDYTVEEEALLNKILEENKKAF